MGMAASTYYTADMVLAMPDDGNRYEVVRGELLVSPPPRVWHEVLVSRLLSGLSAYLELEPVGQVLGSHAGFVWGVDTRVEPDVYVLPLDQARTLDWREIHDLLLVIEVLSPSTSRADRFAKRVEYQRQQVPLYWIIDGEAHSVEVWTPDAVFPAVQRDRLVWHPEGARDPLVIELARLFRPV